ALTFYEADYRVRRAFADLAAIRKINAAHAGLRGKCNELGALGSRNIRWSSAMVEMEFDDGLSLGRFVGDRGKCSETSDLYGSVFPNGHKISRVPITHRDRAGFVEQHDIDITCGLNRLAALGQNVRLKGTVHAGDSDRGQQRADRCRNQAYEQRHQGGNVRAEALQRFCDSEIAHHVDLGIERHWPQWHDHD